MNTKQLFLFCGVWILMAAILGIMCLDFWLFVWMSNIPIGCLVGWAIVTLIESHRGGKK